MQPEFWHERWQLNQIGFHLDRVNPRLAKHHAVLGPAGDASRVLVPLCGKTHDLAWLAQQGHAVLGVELSELAVRAFFEEHELTAREDTYGRFKRFTAERIELLCGDIFDLDAEALGAITAVYDRAALVALPDAMRARYVEHLAALLPTGTRELLVSFEYEPAVGGPPFSVSEDAVRALYAPSFELERLERDDILAAEPRFRERGITSLHELVFALTRRA